MSISRETSRAIYDDACDAYADENHPCHVFRTLQPLVPDGEWELPEPFNGTTAKLGIVFLGLNPSYDPAEAVPRIGISFAEWDAFYRARFNAPIEGWHKLYRRYQSIGELATSNGFRLGMDAIVLEIIRFRSAHGAGCSDSRVLDHELPMTKRVIGELAPKVVVANGSAAMWGTQQLWPQIQRALPVGTRILDVEHKRFRLDTEWGELFVIPTRHLSAGFGYRRALLDRLAEAVRASITTA